MAATLSTLPGGFRIVVAIPQESGEARDDIYGIKVWFGTNNTFDPLSTDTPGPTTTGILGYDGTDFYSDIYTGSTYIGTPLYVKYVFINRADYAYESSDIILASGTVTPEPSNLTGSLTTPASLVQTDSSGNGGVYTNSGGIFKVFEGTVDKTGNGPVYSVQSTSTGLTVSIGTVTGAYTITGLSVDSGVATLRAAYRGINIDLNYSIAKAKTGIQGASGAGGITVILSNESHSVPSASDGSSPVLTGSGTTVKVFEGGTELTYVGTAFGTASTSGTWNFNTIVGTNVTVGSITDSGTHCTIGDITGFTQDTGYITYTINGKLANGVAFSNVQKIQSFSKSKTGSIGPQGSLGPTVSLSYSRDPVFAYTDNTATGDTSNVILTATCNAMSGQTYLWYKDGVSTGTATSTYTVTSAVFSTSVRSAVYKCVVTYNAQTYTDSVTVFRSDRSTAEANATVGATWGTNITSQPANSELYNSQINVDSGVITFYYNTAQGSAPTTPVIGAGAYNFSTKTITAPASWSITPPTTGTGKVWTTTTIFKGTGHTATADDGTNTFTTPLSAYDLNATLGAPSGTYVGSTLAQDVETYSSTAYSGTTNYRTTGSPTNSVTLSGSTAITATADGNALLSIDYTYSQGAKTADGLWIYYSSDSSVTVADPVLTVNPTSGTVRVGVLPGQSYYVGAQAFRRTENGNEATAMVTAGPIASVSSNYTGSLNGTVASTVVTNASNGATAYSGTTNYRTAGTATNQPAITGVTTNATADGNVIANIAYTYTQGTLPADSIDIYWAEGTASPTTTSPSISVSPVSGNLSIPVKPSTNYRFGARTNRVLDSGITSSSITVYTTTVTAAASNYTGSLNGNLISAHLNSNITVDTNGILQGIGTPGISVNNTKAWSSIDTGVLTNDKSLYVGSTTTGVLISSTTNKPRVTVLESSTVRANYGQLDAITVGGGTIPAGYGLSAYDPSGNLVFDTRLSVGIRGNISTNNFAFGTSDVLPNYNTTDYGSNSIGLGTNVLTGGNVARINCVGIGSTVLSNWTSPYSVGIGTNVLSGNFTGTGNEKNVAIGTNILSLAGNAYNPQRSVFIGNDILSVESGGSQYDSILIGSSLANRLNTIQSSVLIGNDIASSNYWFAQGINDSTINSVILGKGAAYAISNYKNVYSTKGNVVVGDSAGYNLCSTGTGVSATYTNSAGSTSITINSTAHEVPLSAIVYIDFTGTNPPTSGYYTVSAVSTNSFSVTHGSSLGTAHTTIACNYSNDKIIGGFSTGSYNVLLGYGAGSFITTGYGNIAIGVGTLGSYQTPDSAINTPAYRTTGRDNIVIGNNAGRIGGNGARNIFIGYFAGSSFTGTNSDVVIIGGHTGASLGSNDIVIADGAGNSRLFWDHSASKWLTNNLSLDLGSGNLITSGTVDGVDISTLESAVAKTADSETITNNWSFTGSGTTIGGSNFDNGWLKIGSSTTGWAFDGNEFYTAGDCIIGSLVGSTMTFSNRPAFNGGTTGTDSPFTVDSTYVVANLNADLLDGNDSSYFIDTSATSQTKSGNLTVADLTVSGGNVISNTSSSKVKYSVYSDASTYGMGFQSAVTYGGLNDWAVTFSNSNINARGFWWGDTTHTLAQGAMALTTNGLLTVAGGMRLGFGESDATDPTTGKLEVNGDITTSGSISTSGQFISSISTGTAPLSVASTTLVSDLNADKVDNTDLIDFWTSREYNFAEGAYVGLNSYYNSGWYTRTAQDGAFAWRNGGDGVGLQLFVNDGPVSANTTFTYSAYAWRDGDFFSNSNKFWHAGNDGSGSGLDADLLDGYNSSQANTINTVAVRDGSGDINCRLIRQEYTDQSTISGGMVFRVNNSTDNYLRVCNSTSAIRTYLGLGSSATVNTGTSGNTIPLLDGTNTWSNNQSISVSSAGSALTVTNSNTAGTSLVTSGITLIDSTQSVAYASDVYPSLQVNDINQRAIGLSTWSNSANGPVIYFAKSRSTTIGTFNSTTNTIAAGDNFGSLQFYGDDGINASAGDFNSNAGTFVCEAVSPVTARDKLTARFKIRVAMGSNLTSDIATFNGHASGLGSAHIALLPTTANTLGTTASGALQVSGGAGIAGNLTVGSSLRVGSVAQIPAGAVGTPSLAFSDDTDTGIYRSGTNTLAITTGGTQAVTVNANGDMEVIGRLRSSGNQSVISWTTTGVSFDIAAATFTDTSSAATATVDSRASSSINRPTFASTNAITVTNAATLYINNSPLAGSNTTISNAYSLWVDNGNCLFDNDVTINGTLNVRTAIDLADSDILRFGSSDDWELFHDGTNNYMDLNVGNLIIRDNTTTRATLERTTGNLTLTGDIAVNGGDLTTTAATFNLVNTTATTLNVGGAASTVNIGSDTEGSTLNINNGFIVNRYTTDNTFTAGKQSRLLSATKATATASDTVTLQIKNLKNNVVFCAGKIKISFSKGTNPQWRFAYKEYGFMYSHNNTPSTVTNTEGALTSEIFNLNNGTAYLTVGTPTVTLDGNAGEVLFNWPVTATTVSDSLIVVVEIEYITPNPVHGLMSNVASPTSGDNGTIHLYIT
jgi:hypothetical protein